MTKTSVWGLTKEFVRQMQSETDRACAILGVAMLDGGLRQLFEARLTRRNHRDLFEGHGPLSSFAARADIASAFGWLPAPEHSEVTLLRRIRNDFAHDFSHNLTFVTPEIKARCESLRFPQLVIQSADTGISEKEPKSIKGSPRKRFEISVSAMCWVITRRINASRPSVDEPGLKE